MMGAGEGQKSRDVEPLEFRLIPVDEAHGGALSALLSYPHVSIHVLYITVAIVSIETVFMEIDMCYGIDRYK